MVYSQLFLLDADATIEKGGKSSSDSSESWCRYRRKIHGGTILNDL